jgi:hypothetical protein
VKRLIEIEAPDGYWWKSGKLQRNPHPPFSSHMIFRTLKKARSKIDGIFNTMPEILKVSLLVWDWVGSKRTLLETEFYRRTNDRLFQDD